MYKCVRYVAPSKSCWPIDVRLLAVRSSDEMPLMLNKSEYANSDKSPGVELDRRPRPVKLATPNLPPQLMHVTLSRPAKLCAVMASAPSTPTLSVSSAGRARAYGGRTSPTNRVRACRPRRAEVENVCASAGPAPGCSDRPTMPSARARMAGFMPAVLAAFSVTKKASDWASTTAATARHAVS